VSAGSGYLRIYPGLTDGHFASPIELALTGESPAFLIAADLNGDGLPDVVSADAAGKSLTLFFGKEGECPLDSANTITGFVAARGFDVADFDRDGAPDVFLTPATQPQAYVYLKPGGTSPTAPTFSVDLPERYRTLAVADLSDDDVPDLAGTNLELEAVVVALLDAEGKGTQAAHAGGRKLPQMLRVGRIDADAFLDIAVPAHGSNQISVFRGHGDGAFDERAIGVDDGPPAERRPRRRRRRYENGPCGLSADLSAESSSRIRTVPSGRPCSHSDILGATSSTSQPPISTGMASWTLPWRTRKAREVLVAPGKGDGTFGETVEIQFEATPGGCAAGRCRRRRAPRGKRRKRDGADDRDRQQSGSAPLRETREPPS
jgi:hypothetical protein